MTSKCGRFILPVVVFTFIIVSCPVYALGCVYLVSNLIELALYLLIFSVLFIVLLWSFLATVFTPVATVPPNYKLTDQEFELLSTKDGLEKNKLLQTYIKGKNLLIQTRSSAGSVRYCLKCKHLKPDRAHHCSTCGVCVLKMDHHCPWVNNCIGFSNQKFFILLHFYTTLYCSYIVCTSIRYVVPMHDDYLLDYYVVWFV
ncbi:hypothetical protein NQ315_007684 [Exocentrus adspersus]|uniref:Palmitoyltransferase n=1 Tax=Exocentrus adspersus TaxID=1586481 RepID=A0AAV8W7P8_9CUCU|nr:hypothetical protein NQ315_007684 [Exocentrus adspersus]